jgi:hypothetical protein
VKIVEGKFNLWLVRNDRIVERLQTKNMVVNGSRPWMANLGRENPLSSPIRAVAIGTSSTAPALTQTGLVAEVFRKVIPASGTDLPTQANLIVTSPNTIVTIRQLMSPFVANDGIPSAGLVPPVTIREFGLFGDIAEIANPVTALTAPSFSANSSAGNVPAATYNVTYSWSNSVGETTAPTAYGYNFSNPPNTQFVVTIPAPPSTATQVNLYINGFLYGSTSSNLSNPQITVNTTPPGSGQTPKSTNTSFKPGSLNSGTMINRAIIGPVTMNDGDRIILESVLAWG